MSTSNESVSTVEVEGQGAGFVRLSISGLLSDQSGTYHSGEVVLSVESAQQIVASLQAQIDEAS